MAKNEKPITTAYKKILESPDDLRCYQGGFYQLKGNNWELLNSITNYIYEKFGITITSKGEITWLFNLLNCKESPVYVASDKKNFPIRTANGYDIITSDTGLVVLPCSNRFTPYNIPIDYDENATGPTVDKFLSDVVSEHSTVENLCEILGEPLIRNGKKSNKAHLIHGPQGCGKSVFVELFYALYGDSATCVPFSNIKDGKRCHDLTHSIVNVDDDIEEFQKGDVKRVKQVITRNSFSVDILYSNTTLELNPNFCNIYSCNDLPEFSSKGREMSIRFRTEEFTHQFRGTGNDDKDMDKKLRKELPYLLNLCIEGANRLIQRGMKFNETEESNNFAKAVEEQDTVYIFLNDFEGNLEGRTVASMKREYIKYTKDLDKKPVSSNPKFNRRMSELGWVQKLERVDGKPTRCWYKKENN